MTVAIEIAFEVGNLFGIERHDAAEASGAVHRFGVFDKMHAVDERAGNGFCDDHLPMSPDQQTMMRAEGIRQGAAKRRAADMARIMMHWDSACPADGVVFDRLQR